MEAHNNNSAYGLFQKGLHLCLLSVGLFATSACVGGGIGDPCIPEAIPPGGFVADEAFLELSSVGCRTRVCLVFELAGDPRYVSDETPEVDTCPDSGFPPGSDMVESPVPCPTAAEVERRVFCSDRCESDTDCPDDFKCEPILEIGGEGIRGSYCVRRSALSPQ